MKADEIRQMTDDELKEKLEDLETELSNLRLQQATYQIQNPNAIKFVRRDIGRIKTIMRERELGINQSEKMS
ncbi:MAG: 50S ribosomal protein L29 [Calditrichia bacterium]